MKELIRPPIKPATIESIVKWAEQVSRVINNLVNDIPADSTASDVAGVVADLNTLQDAIKNIDVR